jgi:hypothetical protein
VKSFVLVLSDVTKRLQSVIKGCDVCCKFLRNEKVIAIKTLCACLMDRSFVWIWVSASGIMKEFKYNECFIKIMK